MNILAVDTAGKSAAVAILRDDTLLYETQCNNGMTHSETLLPMIDTALRACGLTMEDIDLLAALPGCASGVRWSRGWPGRGRFPARAFPPWQRWPMAWRARALSSVRRTPAAGRCTGALLTWPPTPA